VPGRRTLASLGALGALALAGCVGPPGTSDAEVAQLDRVDLSDVCVYYRPDDLAEAQARALAPEVQRVRRDVADMLGVEPPRAELVVYEQPGVGSNALVRSTPAEMRDGRVRFRYPWSEGDALLRAQLLGTVAHELAEAALLSRVTVIDPYVRWTHDGVAEVVEHEVLARLDPEACRASLRRVLRHVGGQRDAGVEWVDLTRWRQLAGWVIRSHRYLDPPEHNLDLDDPGAALNEVRALRARVPADGLRGRGLAELEELLVEARAVGGRPWREGEARPDDPETRDFVFYNAAFAVWLGLERAAPGTIERFLAALVARRAAGDHVLTAAEVAGLVRRASGGAELPPLDRLPLADVEAAVRAEARRLGAETDQSE